jgi:hypothetical protein
MITGDYYLKFPVGWIKLLRNELHKSFPKYRKLKEWLPPVNEKSRIGKVARFFPSRPQGITIGGVINYTPIYPERKTEFFLKVGEPEAFLYEFGMYAHEAYHAVDQELTNSLSLCKLPLLSKYNRWLLTYILRGIKTPNPYNHPMEYPAYAFQERLKLLARTTYEE